MKNCGLADKIELVICSPLLRYNIPLTFLEYFSCSSFYLSVAFWKGLLKSVLCALGLLFGSTILCSLN